MSLEQILKEIKEVKPFAEGDAEVGPIETLNGRRGRKNQAIERLSQLKLQYKRDLMRTAQYLVVVGTLRNELTEALTAPKIGLFSADPNQFYNDLAGRVNPALYQGRASPSELFDVVGRYLEDKASELDIVAYPQLIFKESYVRPINTSQDFVSLIRTAINDQMGTEIVGIQAVNSIVDSAIAKNHDAKSTSIVLNADADLALDILRDFDRLTNRVYVLLAGETDSASLGQALGKEEVIRVQEVNGQTVKQVINTLKNKRNS